MPQVIQAQRSGQPTDPEKTTSGKTTARGGTASKFLLLALLLVIFAFNNVDRLALGLLVQDLKHSLNLTDTQLGFLSGIAFALFYSVMGLPLSRWADRGDRVRIIAITTALWSVAVALCGAAASYLQLMVIRIGVAVGEAGCVPTSQSLIADYFSRAERPRALAIYGLGMPLSMVIAYLSAGWVDQMYGWRATFVILGLPGFALSAMAWFLLREPRRQNCASTAANSAALETLSLREIGVSLARNNAFRHLLLAYSVASFFGGGIQQWKPAFFIRSFGFQTGTLGTWLALIYGVCGLVGTYGGGALASRYAADNERLQMKAMACGYCAFALVSVGMYLSTSAPLSMSLLALATLGGYAIYGPMFATIHALVPARMRAVAIALIFLFANLVGQGLGPLAVGALSDALHPYFREESLRYALLASSPGYLWTACHLWLAQKSVRRDLSFAMQA